MSDPVVDEKLIIIGLDGATWKIIDPLVQKGQLPNLARLIREGASGNLRSLDPMISTMLWTTISSGKLPDKHGIRDFAVSSKAVRCKRIWDILAQQGLTVGVYGHMITWPPDPIQGFMVPGSFAMGSETHPPDLSFLRKLTLDETSGGKRHYAEYLGYGWKALKKGVSPRTLFQMAVHLTKETLGNMDPLSDFYRKRLLKLRLDREVFLHLCRKFKPHLAYFYTHLLDSTQHLFWKYMEPDNFTNIAEHDVTRYGQFIFEAYREADKSLGQILSALGSDTTVIVVSDHGGEALSCSVEESAVTIKTENLLKKLGLWGQVMIPD
jgi:predicted AlkP superfamily phosphohydrolase/phosphomutase